MATTLVGAAGAWAVADLVAGGTVLAVGAVGLLVASRGWMADLDAIDAVVGAAERDSAMPDGGAGLSARLAEQFGRRTELVRAAEAAGRRAVEHTADVIDAAPSGVAVIGPDGRIEHVNKALRELLDLRGQPVGLMPVEALRVVEILEALEEANQVGEGAPRDFVRGDMDLSVSAHAMRDGMLVVVRDVSRERQVERARTDFVANVSHELRTPIAAILGYAETLLDTPGGLSEDVAPLVRTIQRNGRRLRQLFEDLLALHKIEARRRELPREELALAPLLMSAVVVAADAASAKGISFRTTCDDDVTVYANQQALSAMVGNLASNACKYTSDGGTVEVLGVRVDGGVRIDVRDNGMGIPRHAVQRVFERFYRVDEGRAREVGGTGLGLAIVKHLAQATAARVSVTSEEGKGSTFSVHLPSSAPAGAVRTWEATLNR